MRPTNANPERSARYRTIPFSDEDAMTKPIHQEVTIRSSAKKIFDALTDAKQFSALSGGAPAEIGATAGGSFSCFGGHIVGRNIELVPGKRVVQAWRSVKWTEGVYSIVRFELHEEGGTAKIVFDQAGFPEEAGSHLESGWTKMYWEPLKAYLE
jgi:uncharacterized protein YndB with AHSA1/START domain